MNWLNNNAFPKIFAKSFLGTEPPAKWKSIVDEIENECDKPGDFCDKPVQDKFGQCVHDKMGALLLELGPWITKNCETLDKEVVQGWSKKMPLLSAMMTDFVKKFKL